MGCVSSTTSKSVNAVTQALRHITNWNRPRGFDSGRSFLPKSKLVTLQRYAIYLARKPIHNAVKEAMSTTNLSACASELFYRLRIPIVCGRQCACTQGLGSADAFLISSMSLLWHRVREYPAGAAGNLPTETCIKSEVIEKKVPTAKRVFLTHPPQPRNPA
jgi:hypothetical protein